MIVHGIKDRAIAITNTRVEQTAFQTPTGVQTCEMLIIETTDPNPNRKKGAVEVRSISFQELDQLVAARDAYLNDKADVQVLDQDEPAVAV